MGKEFLKKIEQIRDPLVKSEN